MMKRFFIVLFLALLSVSWSSMASDANEMPDVSVKKGVTLQYKTKLEPGSRVEYIVNWKYYEQQGTILVVRQLSEGYPSCILYQLEGEEPRIIQGQPFCKWAGKPVVASREDAVLIEFPIKVKQSVDFPYIDSTLQVNFDSIRKNICSYDIFYGPNAATIEKCEKLK